MYQLAINIRRLIYVIICYQCMLQLTNGSSYQKYLKFVSYMIVLCISCRILISFIGNVESSIYDAGKMYESWITQWELQEKEYSNDLYKINGSNKIHEKIMGQNRGIE